MNEIEKSIYLELFAATPSKSDRTKLAIVQAAIRCYARASLDGISYYDIAKEAKVTRPLVQRYFPNKGELFVLMVKYIRGHFQHLAIQAIRQERTPEKMLEAYVRSTFDWREKLLDHGIVWLLFYYRCTVDEKCKQLNSDLVNMGYERIKQILLEGKKQGLFRCKKPEVTAKLIQLNITGALIASATETGALGLRELRENTLKLCRELARG